MPADPLVDEEFMVEALSTKVSPQTIARLQTGAMMLLIDAYDRKTTRMEFAQIADAAVKAYGQTAKLWLLTNIKEASDSGYLDADHIDEAQVALIAHVADLTHAARDLALLLKQCPLKEDKVH
jgi:ABC-type transporter Mla MlaB component